MSDDEKVTRSPVYHVFEGCADVFTAADLRAALRGLAGRVKANDGADYSGEADEIADEAMKVALKAWFPIRSDVPGATDRKAIESVIGTHEHPVEDFDADRRLLPHVAVLTCHWRVRERTRTVNEPTPEERAELEARLAGTVTEEWAS